MTTADRAHALTILRASPWLAIAPEALAGALCEHGRLARFAEGRWAHGEGDETGGLLVVVEGAIQLYAQGPGEREILVAHLEESGAMGQTARYGGGPRLVTAICAAPSTLLLASDRALERIADAHPEIWRAVATLTYMQLGAMVAGAAQLAGLPPRQRLAARLVMLSHRMAGGRRADLSISQHALAEMVGLTRKTANIHLAAFQRAGLVALGYGRIDLLDLSGLERLAAG